MKYEVEIEERADVTGWPWVAVRNLLKHGFTLRYEGARLFAIRWVAI